MKIIVLSGINLTEGGPLTIYKECLTYVEKYLLKNYKIIALVHNKKLFSEFDSKIEFIEYKEAKSSYLKRCYYEYLYFKKLSETIKPYLWFSLHDMTPNVIAENRAVYCHNPIIFYKMKSRDILREWRLFFFTKLYKYIYRINIKKNQHVVVQQNWIREEFKKRFKLKNIIVAHPNIDLGDISFMENYQIKEKNSFIYASFPRIFKNFEVICEAVKILEEKNIKKFQVYLTIDGKENRYSKTLYEKYKHLKSIKFVGLLPREELIQYYQKVDCVIFPSKLETWGLPITEAKELEKKILLADLPYAHETLGDYDKVFFFEPNNAKELAMKMEIILRKQDIEYDGNIAKKIEEPYSRNWEELFKILLLDSNIK